MDVRPTPYATPFGLILRIVAVVLFLLAAFGLGSLGPVATTPLGLAFFAGSFLI